MLERRPRGRSPLPGLRSSPILADTAALPLGCEEDGVLYATDGLLNSTSRTSDVLYVG